LKNILEELTEERAGRRNRDEEERGEIDHTNWSSVEFDGWRYDKGSI
jgi:hypothetical protein